MKALTHTLFPIGALIMAVSLSAFASDTTNQGEASNHYKDGEFINSEPFAKPSLSKTLGIIKRFIFEAKINTEPKSPIPVLKIEASDLTTPLSEQTAVYRLGHSTILMELTGQLWMTDPVFSERASPVQWAGPKRFHPTPIDLDALPQISGVIISHDHYDHLDKNTIKQMHPKVDNFYVPMGVGQHLIDWGVPSDKIHEFDWWQEKQVGDITLVNTPANHFSERGLNDGNTTLWSSWVIQTPQYKLYFSGDSGYFSGFKEIGDKYGPFDLTMIENGAYDKNWKFVHMTPEQTMQAHMDLRGKVMLPIHNGTFDLAFHEWTDPFERIQQLAIKNKQILATPLMGERWLLDEVAPQTAWWRQVKQANPQKVVKNKELKGYGVALSTSESDLPKAKLFTEASESFSHFTTEPE
jgi:L-ascorbate metabolism protein UlaG (beta-lactamase superfamily)